MSEIERQVQAIVGETLSEIDIGDDQILLTTISGRKFIFDHAQDCCETVRIESVSGEAKTLIGKVVRAVEYEANEGKDPPPSEYAESWTRTNITFRVDDSTVITKWIGESNGYYSETVDFHEVE